MHLGRWIGGVFLLGAIVGVPPAGAQTSYNWSQLSGGVADGSWSQGTNWSPAGPAYGAGNTAQFTQPATTSANLTLDGSYTIGNLLFGNPSGSAVGWVLSPGTGGYLTLGAPGGTPQIQVTNQSATLAVQLTGTQGFTLGGGGVLNLNLADSLTGPVVVNSGALVLNSLNALPPGATLNVAAGALVQPRLAGTYPSLPITLNGASYLNGSFGGSLEFHSGGVSSVIWPGAINLNASDATIGTYGVVYNVTLAGALTGGGNLNLRPEGGSAGSHTATFLIGHANNTYAGSTTMYVGTAQLSATLKLGVNQGLPAGTTLNLTRAGGTGAVYFDLAGWNQSIAGLTANFAGNAVINSAAAGGTLTLNNPANLTYSGTLGAPGQANFNLVKQGAGTLTLAGTNQYSGLTTISAGTLALAAPVTGTSGLNLGANGTLLVTVGGPVARTNVVVNGNVTLAGALNLSDAGIIANTPYPVIAYSGVLNTNGLTAAPLAPWAFTLDTSIPHLLRIVPMQKFPLVQFAGTNFTVNSLTTNLGGVLRGTPTGPLWYEVRDQTNHLWDFGATAAQTPWGITVRHLRAGTNTVTVFAQDGSGTIQSNQLQLTLPATAWPTVRPRPVPSEIWWGGLSDNTQMTNFTQWPFVQRFQDGYFFHSAGWSPGAQGPLMQQLAAYLAAYNTKFWPELGGDCPNPSTTWYQGQTNGWGGWALGCQNHGIIWSEFTHDYHMENMQPVCQVNPGWSNADQIAWWTGDLTVADGAYPYPGGIWRDTFNGYYQRFPHVKVGHTSSPVWWPWGGAPALVANNLAFTVPNGTGGNTAFNFTADQIVGSFVSMAAAINHPYYSQQTDCPWDYFGANQVGSAAAEQSNRAKIRVYERYLQGRNARHTLICNVSNAGTNAQGSATAADLYYEGSSLASMMLHQQEGGRANRYLYESWYFGVPYAVVPETQPGSYTHLALSAIKYLKGIADTNGNLEALNLSVSAGAGTLSVLQLRNDGDVACLPALAGQAGGVPGVATRYFTTNGAEVTPSVLTTEGWCLTNLLAAGAATNFFAVTLAHGLTAPTNENAAVEAFWNPQDPLGVVRDRSFLNAPLSPPALWTDTDLGSVGVAGGSALSGNTLTVLGSGADFSGTSDAGHFVWQSIATDGVITARVARQTAADVWSKAGVMIRESAAPGARTLFVGVTPAEGVTFQWRPATFGQVYNTTVAGPVAPCWVRLVRIGTNFAAWYSPNGTTWTSLGSTNFAGFPNTAQWGVAVSAHNNALVSAAVFDNLALPNAAPVLAPLANQQLTAGQTLALGNLATDVNSPPQTLGYSLLNAPVGMTIDPALGRVTWRPTIAQSPSTNPVSVVVTDNGTPPLSATQSVVVTVLRPVAPGLSAAPLGRAGFTLTIGGGAGPDYYLQSTTNLVPPAIWRPVQTNLSATPPFTFTDSAATNPGPARFYRILLGP